MTEWTTPDGGGSTFTLDGLRAALPAVAVEPVLNGYVAGAADPDIASTELLNPIRALIEQIKAGPVWHNPVLRLVAMLVARGTPSCVIEAMAPDLTWPGYTVQQTRAELVTMIAGAHRKGFAPEQGEPGDHAEDAASIEAEVMDVPLKATPASIRILRR